MHGDWSARDNVALAALRKALAAEPTKPEPVASDDDEEFTREDVTTLLLEVMDWTYAKAHRNRPMTEAEQKVLNDIRTALAAEQPKREFDHSIGADRFKVVRGIFWWHVKIGDSPTEHGKFRSSEAAQKMADDLLREFRNGAFVQNALAAEQPKPKPEPVAVFDEQMGHPVLLLGSPMLKDKQPLYTAPPATHPGYVIGSHWLETAYSRICAGEAEADVLRDIGLVREEAFLTGVAHLKAENEALRRDAERWRFYEAAGSNLTLRLHNTRSDHRNAAIDAAMQEDKT